MKIAQVVIGYNAFVGGYGRVVNLLASELRRRGHKVDVISTKFNPGKEDKDKVIRLWNDPWLRITPGLFNYLLKNNYDVVHVHGYPSFQPFITALTHSFKKFPLVFTPHYHPFGNKPRIIRVMFDKTFGCYALSKADVVLAITDYEKELLAKMGAKRVEVIPNPLFFQKPLSGFKKKHGLSNYILFVGRIEEQKGLQYLVRAVKGLGLKLVVIGADAGYKTDVDKIISEEKIDNVMMMGKVSDDELRQAYTECEFLVLPSKYEAFGLVLIEAMNYGKPVIASRIGTVQSIVKGAGLLVDYGDVNGLREAIIKLSNKRVAKSMGLKAKQLVKDYDVKRIVNKLLGVYKSL